RAIVIENRLPDQQRLALAPDKPLALVTERGGWFDGQTRFRRHSARDPDAIDCQARIVLRGVEDQTESDQLAA
ncbi:hypothetical protein RZS08_27305, partial [Arthrospira platensis SPKY1]|nr:hypothetical protein [Arthrospira platensis SPKY1]